MFLICRTLLFSEITSFFVAKPSLSSEIPHPIVYFFYLIRPNLV
ncbi:hypothetical protein HMPREF0653_00201 [Prevotella disiens JCM 6334 = ATCC 29426]|uniref:Uncharacterized protein n=1 Tax=Prevotella disiens JCM 6334 = ATCC 29426 TaxID=1235811 RepID=A0ABN0NV83_9BACT|nr:hypothetical protein HMPREF0653_00201 [Prevotella disiens JCM 6334 = ATCC 29426]